jgi:epoxyqueuosine reductase
MHDIKDSAKWIEAIIKDFINKSSYNTLKNKENEKAWEEPLIGFSNGNDSLYQKYKECIGPFHWTPLEIFLNTFPNIEIQAEDLSVITWILPATENIKSDNRKEKKYPSERWARARIFGEETNEKLRKHVVVALQECGFKAIAPSLSPSWKSTQFGGYPIASTWSERHAAYASGLGTFGLCDGLITKRGKAIRCGSVVSNIKILPTKRPYDNHHAYCLFFSKGTCGKCMERCPAGAITPKKHDKFKCASYLLGDVKKHSNFHFDYEWYGCGLCQTGVPCESKIPSSEMVSGGK